MVWVNYLNFRGALMKKIKAQDSINFRSDGYKAKMKKDTRNKRGIEFKRGEDVVINWLEETPQMTYIIKQDGNRLRVKSEWAYHFVTGVNKTPSINQMERWDNEGYSKSMLGKKVEPDGFDPNGSPSWMLVIGII